MGYLPFMETPKYPKLITLSHYSPLFIQSSPSPWITINIIHFKMGSSMKKHHLGVSHGFSIYRWDFFPLQTNHQWGLPPWPPQRPPGLQALGGTVPVVPRWPRSCWAKRGVEKVEQGGKTWEKTWGNRPRNVFFCWKNLEQPGKIGKKWEHHGGTLRASSESWMIMTWHWNNHGDLWIPHFKNFPRRKINEHQNLMTIHETKGNYAWFWFAVNHGKGYHINMVFLQDMSSCGAWARKFYIHVGSPTT